MKPRFGRTARESQLDSTQMNASQATYKYAPDPRSSVTLHSCRHQPSARTFRGFSTIGSLLAKPRRPLRLPLLQASRGSAAGSPLQIHRMTWFCFLTGSTEKVSCKSISVRARGEVRGHGKSRPFLNAQATRMFHPKQSGSPSAATPTAREYVLFGSE